MITLEEKFKWKEHLEELENKYKEIPREIK